MAADALAPYVARTSAEYVGPSLTRGSILSACVKSMWRNDIKCKYMFMFPQKNLARKGLKRIRWINNTKHCERTKIIDDVMARAIHNKGLSKFVSFVRYTRNTMSTDKLKNMKFEVSHFRGEKRPTENSDDRIPTMFGAAN